MTEKAKLSIFQDKEKQPWLQRANAVATPTGWVNVETGEQLTYDTTLIERGAKPVLGEAKEAKEVEKKASVSKEKEKEVEAVSEEKATHSSSSPKKKK